MAPVLEIADLGFERGPAGARFRLELPRLTLERGAFLALTGDSGSGKSTLLDLLGLVLVPEPGARFRLTRRSGAIEDVAARLTNGGLDALADIRRDAIGYILQQGGLLPFLTLRENIRITQPTDRAAPLALEDLAGRLGIDGLLDRTPAQISIGQRQRVAIARAIMGDPELILADEPTASLDPPTARRTLELLVEIVAERDLAVIMASHSWALVEDFGFARLSPVLSTDDRGTIAVFQPAVAAAA